MIEVVSHPTDLAIWDPAQDPFYLELYGETRPVVDTTFAEVQPSGLATGSAIDASATPSQRPIEAASATPIYQYWWTIGHDGDPQQIRDLWSQLKDPEAAHVYLYFPLDKGWRVKEVVATVKYLKPFHEQDGFWRKLGDDWKNLMVPAVADAGALAGLVPNPLIAGVSPILSAIAKLQINSIPQVPGFEWSVAKVATRRETLGVMQGVIWTLPKKMFTELGGRLTGSIALSFIPSHIQQRRVVAEDQPAFQQGAILAHAGVYKHDGNEFWEPAKNGFVELQIAPRVG